MTDSKVREWANLHNFSITCLQLTFTVWRDHSMPPTFFLPATPNSLHLFVHLYVEVWLR